ncbi:SDR family NAD(P)-dependent oxidoreductase [Tundrisphaera sp. TA3]|uniref:SDR family NAD(P)-dependent oxidoreductase n=1 Tax=Tundrisphaera sp. TA3 TaxID=3435775 RepID=UPI003EB6B5D7
MRPGFPGPTRVSAGPHRWPRAVEAQVVIRSRLRRGRGGCEPGRRGRWGDPIRAGRHDHRVWGRGVDRAGRRRLARIDYAFTNASVEGPGGPTREHAEEASDRVMAANLHGIWLGMRIEIPRMLAQRGGALVNAASILRLVAALDAACDLTLKAAGDRRVSRGAWRRRRDRTRDRGGAREPRMG